MAYKQPYKQVNKKQDGASILPALAAIPAIVKGIAAAAKIGKVAATAAKGIKVASTAAKAGKAIGTAAKAGKAVGTAAKAGKAAATAGKAAKAAKGAGKLTKIATKGAKAGKKGGKVFKKIGEAGKKALDKGKKIVEKGTEKLDKFKEGYDKVAGKVSDATGFDKDVVKEFGTNQASNAVTAIQNKIQGGGDDAMDPAERGTPSGITPMQSQGGGGYENPDGTSMFDYRKNHSPNVKSKYDNVGPSMKPITITNAEGGNVTYRSSKDGASVDGDGLDKFDIEKDNLFRNSFGDSKLSSFSAPITIKGVTFDAGDAIRLGILGYKGAKKGVENYKANAGERAMKKSDRQNNISKKERTKITADQNAENKRDARTKPNAKVKNSVLGNTKSVVQSRKKASQDMKKSDERRKKLLNKKPTPKKNTVVKRKLKVADGFAGIGMPNASTLRIRKS
jgi:hypothetical protein